MSLSVVYIQRERVAFGRLRARGEESNTSPTSTHSKHSMKGVCVGVRFSLRGKHHHHHHHGQSTFLHPSCWESSLAGLWFDCVHLHTIVITSAVKRLVVINHILNKRFSLHYMWPWSTEAVISSTGIFVARLQYIVWLKIIHFIICQTSLDIKIMFHEDILYCKYIKT